MKGIIIYFSGTGNTEFVIKHIVSEFENKNIQCALLDIAKNNEVKDEYDFYIFASPIHVEIFPKIFVDWLRKKLPKVDHKKCIIVSTQASAVGYGGRQISGILEKKGYDIVYLRSIPMPNNYYMGKFKATPESKKNEMKNEVSNEVNVLVEKFLKGDIYIEKESVYMTALAKVIYKMCIPYFHSYARKNFTVDYNKCIKCKKCQNDCPVNNIRFDEQISFDNKCICCQKCLQKCPVNAFKFKGEHFDQVKL